MANPEALADSANDYRDMQGLCVPVTSFWLATSDIPVTAGESRSHPPRELLEIDLFVEFVIRPQQHHDHHRAAAKAQARIGTISTEHVDGYSTTTHDLLQDLIP